MYEAASKAREGDTAYFDGLAGPELSALVVGRDEDGRTLLHTAAATGNMPLVDLLAQHGAAKVVNKQDDEVSARCGSGSDGGRGGQCIHGPGVRGRAASSP